MNILIPQGLPPNVEALARNIEDFVRQMGRGPQLLSSYTVADLPDATKWANCAVIVSNETGGRTIATSDGTNWKRVKDGATVS